MSEPLPILSSTQVQEKGTYDLLAPLALLFYSTVLCVSSRMGQPWGLRGREGKNSLLGMGGQSPHSSKDKGTARETVHQWHCRWVLPLWWLQMTIWETSSDSPWTPLCRDYLGTHGRDAVTAWSQLQRDSAKRCGVHLLLYPQWSVPPVWSPPVHQTSGTRWLHVHWVSPLQRINICLSWGYLNKDDLALKTIPWQQWPHLGWPPRGQLFRMW